MKTTITTAMVAAIAVAGFSLQEAGACTIRQGSDGLLPGPDCKWSDGEAEEQMQERLPFPIVTFYRAVPRIELPNLQVVNISQGVTATVFTSTLTYRYENDDMRITPNGNYVIAPPFQIRAFYTVTDPLQSGRVVYDDLIVVDVPALAPGADNTINLFLNAPRPNRDQDWDFTVTVELDYPLDRGGIIWETTEMDNYKVEACRAYGPNPDVNGPPPC